MKRSKVNFEGYDCVQLENESIRLQATTSVGPRILGLNLHHGTNLLARLPDATATTPSGKLYQFRGGHRLWFAPEHPEVTYAPDDEILSVNPTERGVNLTQETDTGTGIQKQMNILLPDNTPTVIIDHVLANRGSQPMELAPWAITQLKPGGFAILPQPQTDTGLLPNRRLALWPYSQIGVPQFQLGDHYLFFHATMLDGAFKIGWANPAGWLAYCIDDTLFVKEAAYLTDKEYFDYGSSSECYCNPSILELETLGPKTTLAPGESIAHRETWRLFAHVGLAPTEPAVKAWLSHTGLGGSSSGSG